MRVFRAAERADTLQTQERYLPESHPSWPKWFCANAEPYSLKRLASFLSSGPMAVLLERAVSHYRRRFAPLFNRVAVLGD